MLSNQEQMDRSILPVLLAFSVILAGCNGIMFGGNETPAMTVTPAPVPTDKPTPTPVPQLAPGLTGDGVSDPFELAEAHASALDNISYATRTNFTIRYLNGTVYNQVTTREEYAANHSRFYTMQNGTSIDLYGSKNFQQQIWSNGKRVLVAQMNNTSTSYRVLRTSGGEPIPPQSVYSSRKERIATLFSSIELHVAGQITRDGMILHQVEAINVTNPATFEDDWQNPRNIMFQALVSSQGLVREYRLNYTATLNNSTVRIHRYVHNTGFGNTTVERPTWYDTAIKNVSTAMPTEH